MTENEISRAVRAAATEVGAKAQDVQGYYEAGGDWDAQTPEELADLIATCWREQSEIAPLGRRKMPHYHVELSPAGTPAKEEETPCKR